MITLDELLSQEETTPEQDCEESIRVPTGAVGETKEIELRIRSGNISAKLVDRMERVGTPSPLISDNRAFEGELLNREKESHEFEIRDCQPGKNLRWNSNESEKRRRRKELVTNKK